MEQQSFWPEQPPILLCGPTATGKTAAALLLAEAIGGEIINVDSMQVYAGMDIGTAKPTAQERQRVPFHLLDISTPDRQLTVSEWKQQAEDCLQGIEARGNRAILCGGTGLYIRTLLQNWNLAQTPADPQLREQLMQIAAAEGAPFLHGRLQTIDPVTAARLHPNDAIRIVRALEVYQTTGRPISALQAEDRATHTTRPAVRFCLTLPRPLLNARIDTRVETMLEIGLVREVQSLLQQGYSGELGPMKSLGYKEIVEYLSGQSTYEAAVEEIKIHTRRFAKRQQTWFRAEPFLTWLDVSELHSAEVAHRIQCEMNR